MKTNTALEGSEIWENDEDLDSGVHPQAHGVAAGSHVDAKYMLTRELGRGAAGVVYEAIHRFTRRRVAVKVVTPGVPTAVLPELRARLLREARALAAVRHPGIVDILDGGITRDGSPYIVLELLEGARTLEGILTARTAIGESDTVSLGLQLCSALATAHRAGVVHRDLKPGNIFIHRDMEGRERVRLIDFGIARVHGRDEQRLTRTGAVLGTPEYMAPEQLLALEDVDHRADVYALALTLYECLSGKLPYRGTYQQILVNVASPGAPTPLASMCGAPKALCAVIDRALSKDRALRPRSATEFANELAQAWPGAPELTCLLDPPATREAQGALSRRQAARAPYASPVQITTSEGTIDGRSEDISETGMLFFSRDATEPKGRVAVRFALPLEGRLITCPAEVRWARVGKKGDGAPRAVGLELIGLPEAARVQIAKYVSLMTVGRSGDKS